MTFSKNTSQFPHHFVHAEQKTLNASHTKWTLSGPDDDEIVNCAKPTYGKRRDGKCELAPPFACKCLRVCQRAICLQIFNPPRKFSRKLSTPPRKFARKLSTSPRKFASKLSTSSRKFACKLCTQTFNPTCRITLKLGYIFTLKITLLGRKYGINYIRQEIA